MGAKSTTPKPLRSDTPSQPPPGLEAALFRIGIRRQPEQSYQRLVAFAEKVAGLKGALGRLANQPDRKSDGPDSMVVDMITNGDRQAVRGNCDEAALRYYRAVELCGARRLRLLFKIDNNATPTDKVPSSLREEFPTQCWVPRQRQ